MGGERGEVGGGISSSSERDSKRERVMEREREGGIDRERERENWHRVKSFEGISEVCCSVLQCAVCSVLQCVAPSKIFCRKLSCML